jgi:hypothetical protein
VERFVVAAKRFARRKWPNVHGVAMHTLWDKVFLLILARLWTLLSWHVQFRSFVGLLTNVRGLVDEAKITSFLDNSEELMKVFLSRNLISTGVI